jgi:phosphatidate phosphatase APP1
MIRFAFLLFAFAMTTATTPDVAAQTKAAMTSDARPGEKVVLFATAAARSAEGATWRIPVHGWIYVPQASNVRKAAFAEIFRSRYGLTTPAEPALTFDRRINLLLADNKRGRRIAVKAGSVTALMPESSPNGHFRGELILPATESASVAQATSIELSVVFSKGDARVATTRVQLLEPTGLTIISDIDDTVKITEVLDRKKLFENSFYKPFTAVPGMADFYRKLVGTGVGLHFVSTSPWHLYEPLAEFLTESGYPAGTLHLKQIRLKDRTIFDIAAKGADIKPPIIASIIDRYPARKFLLIGDSGEQDPEVYAGIFKKYPGRIRSIWIRNVTAAKRDDARFAKVFAGIPAEKWRLFDEPSELAGVAP